MLHRVDRPVGSPGGGSSAFALDKTEEQTYEGKKNVRRSERLSCTPSIAHTAGIFVGQLKKK
jgi:hypothetical protein